MPIQSKRISLSALGINIVPGMRYGNHLRVGFDPRMGFPPCGFELYQRRHLTGPKRQIDFVRLFTEKIPALFRRGYSQDGVSIFHPRNPLPVQSVEGGVALKGQKLCISFRASPFSPDSNPKVCEVRLKLRSWGSIVVEAFDDRYDNASFTKRLVAREQRFGPIFDPGVFDNVLERVYRGWAMLVSGVLGAADDTATVPPQPLSDPAEVENTATRVNLDEIVRTSSSHTRHPGQPGVDEDAQLRELRRRFFPELTETPDVPPEPPPPAPATETPTRDRPVVRGLMRFNNFLSSTVFSRAQLFFGVEHDIELRADLISHVEIHAPAGSRLLSFEYAEVRDADWNALASPADAPWGSLKEVPLLLPTPQALDATQSTYPTCTSLLFPKAASVIERDLPVSRLSTGFVARTGIDDVHGEYPDLETHLEVYLGPDPDRLRFKDLDQVMRLIEAEPPSGQLDLLVTHPGEATDESSSFAPLPLILTGAADPSFARLVGLAMIDPNQNVGYRSDYKVVAKWNGISHSWITHDVFPGRDGFLNPPEAPTANAVVDMTRPGGVKTNLELDWHTPDVVSRLNRANQHLGYHVFRRRVDPLEPQLRLTESKDELTGVPTPYPVLLAEIQGEQPTPPPPADHGHYLDRPPAYATFDYGLQAQDVFGRRSEIVWKKDIVIPVLVDPPPVSELYAFYLDTDDPGQAELEPNAAHVLNATGETGFTGRALLIEFRYPKASIDAIVGDVVAFDVSYRHGRPNELLGTLSTPSIVGPIPTEATAPVLADIELSTAVEVPMTIDGFGGERSRGTLASHGEYFAIESATRLDTNLVRLRVRARRDYLPQVGEAALSIGRGGPGISPHPLFVSPRDPGSWSGFDLRHPRGDDSQGALILSSSNNLVLPPMPLALTTGQVIVSRTIEPPANLAPGEPAIPSDWVYRIVVRNVDLPLPVGLSEYPGTLTVQVVSGANRRSELPAPAFVRRRTYGAPPPLTELASSDFVTATRPDFEGRIGVWLTWPKIPGVLHFNIYRADVPKLLSARNAEPILAEDLFEVEANRAEVKLLGGQLASIDAFTLVTPVPIQPDSDPEDPTRHRWVDRVSAPREQNYVYRIQPLGQQGVSASWPADSAVDNENRDRCILVLQKNRDLLLTPAIYELEPLDRAIGVVVRRPLASTITGLRIYKTDQPSQSADVRRMTLIHGTIPFEHTRIEALAAANGTPARLRFVDQKVRVGVQYFYRIVFVDEFGNLSSASEPMAVTPRSLAPPAPPTLSAHRIATDTINLSWVADHDEGQIKVQRKRSGESQWLDVTSDWLSPTDSAVDNQATGIVAHRLLLRDPKGRFVYSDLVITEA